MNSTNITGVNFTGTAVVSTYSISGTVTYNGAGLSGVNFTGSVCTKCTSGTVALTDGTPVTGVTVGAANASATTDATGLYILKPPAGSSAVTGTIVPWKAGYSFTPGNRPCDSHHRTQQDFTAAPAGQGSVKAGGGLKGGSGESGAARPKAGHPEGSFEVSPLKDPGRGASTAVHGNLSGTSYGVRPHGGPGPCPFGREEGCSGMDEGASAGMESEAAAAEAVRTEAAALSNTATYFYAWDQVGSVRVVTDASGQVVVIHDYEPYGVEILPNTPASMPTDALAGTHLYTGQERDADTGLDNFHFRSYASTMGRFLSPDNLPGTPLNPQSFNLYAYVHGNPVNYNDPTGHWAGGLPPGQRYDNGDPFGGLDWVPTGGIFEPLSAVDALMDNLPNPAQQANAQPAAQEKQDPKPTAGQQGTKAQRGHTLTESQVSGQGGNPAGHIVVSVDNGPQVGYGPKKDLSRGQVVKEALDSSVSTPGQVEPRAPGTKVLKSVTFHVSGRRAKDAQAEIELWTSNPGNYQLKEHSCVTFGEAVAAAAGVPAPNDLFPAFMIRDLQKEQQAGVAP